MTMATGAAHPLYSLFRPVWVKLLDVYEGAGGFLDPARPYLIPHPREWLDHSIPIRSADGVTVTGYTVNPNPTLPSPKLLEGRRLARYENVAATLVNQLAGALFRVRPDRSYGARATRPGTGALRPHEAFWANADGQGTGWDDCLRQAWNSAAAFGHMYGYVDVDEARALPIVRWYTPLDVPDWLTDARGNLAGVRLLEAVARRGFEDRSRAHTRIREVTKDGWRLYESNGRLVDEGTHEYGILPVFTLYARRRALTAQIGKSLIGDPQLYIDLYNLISETRELLRKQTFSILNVPLGPDADLARETAMIGQQSGTGNLLFTSRAARMLSADQRNVTVYHEHMDRLTRLIYRLAVVAWEGDSKDAESAESRKIKREDLNQQLAGFADELQMVDRFVSDMVYRVRYGAAWQQWKRTDALTIAWPDNFDVTPLEDLTRIFTEAIGLALGPTATRELRKRMARATMPTLSKEAQAVIDREIDTAPDDPRAERRGRAWQARLARVVETLGPGTVQP